MKNKTLQHRFITVNGEKRKFPVFGDETAGSIKDALVTAFNLDRSLKYDLQDSQGNVIKGYKLLNDTPGDLQLVHRPPAVVDAPMEWDLDDAEAMPNTIPTNIYR